MMEEKILKKRIRSLRKYLRYIQNATADHLFEMTDCEKWEDNWFKGNCPVINCSECITKQAFYIDKKLKISQTPELLGGEVC